MPCSAQAAPLSPPCPALPAHPGASSQDSAVEAGLLLPPDVSCARCPRVCLALQAQEPVAGGPVPGRGSLTAGGWLEVGSLCTWAQARGPCPLGPAAPGYSSGPAEASCTCFPGVPLLGQACSFPRTGIPGPTLTPRPLPSLALVGCPLKLSLDSHSVTPTAWR